MIAIRKKYQIVFGTGVSLLFFSIYFLFAGLYLSLFEIIYGLSLILVFNFTELIDRLINKKSKLLFTCLFILQFPYHLEKIKYHLDNASSNVYFLTFVYVPIIITLYGLVVLYLNQNRGLSVKSIETEVTFNDNKLIFVPLIFTLLLFYLLFVGF